MSRAPITAEERKARLLLWAEALESGEFTQERQALRYKDGFCCLGVACEIARRHGLGEWVYPYTFSTDAEECSGTLPNPVYEWYGLTDSDPVLIDSSGEADDASRWNDTHNATFPQIAAMVRSLADGVSE